MIIACAIILALISLHRWWRLSRCRACSPRCPNAHRSEIAGNEGFFVASMCVLLCAVIEAAL